MEVDAVFMKGDKGKGKDKGKGQDKGKGKDKGGKGYGGYNYFGKDGGKGKGKKGKDGEKLVPGTDGSVSQAKCHGCHQKGHIQRLCPSARKVHALGAEQQQEQEQQQQQQSALVSAVQAQPNDDSWQR